MHSHYWYIFENHLQIKVILTMDISKIVGKLKFVARRINQFTRRQWRQNGGFENCETKKHGISVTTEKISLHKFCTRWHKSEWIINLKKLILREWFFLRFFSGKAIKGCIQYNRSKDCFMFSFALDCVPQPGILILELSNLENVKNITTKKSPQTSEVIASDVPAGNISFLVTY